jgi:hypothetical protein
MQVLNVLVSGSRRHREVDLAFGSKLDRLRITGVYVTKHAHSRIARENAFESSLGIFGAVRDDNHAGMLRKTDAHAAAVVDRNPRCAARGVDERVEQRPVGNCVAAVEHAFRFAIGGRD